MKPNKDFTDDYGKTEPSGGFGEYGATEPMDFSQSKTGPAPKGSGFADYSPTEASGVSWNPSQTVPPSSGFTPKSDYSYDFKVQDFDRHPNGMPDSDITRDDRVTDPIGYGYTVPLTNPYGAGFMPVVGWLVCVEGPERGRDYRIHEGYNSIGRDPSMDICISGDTKISRQRDARIAYDPDEKIFYFSPADGKNLVKLNGKTLMNSAELKPYDTLTIGVCKLMFVPFCGEAFSWADEK